MGLDYEQPAPMTDALPDAVARRPRSRRAVRLQIVTMLALVDFACLIVPYILVGQIYPVASDQAMLSALFLIPIYFISAFTGGAFSSVIFTNTGKAIRTATHALLVAAGSTLCLVFFLKSGADLSRLAFAGGLIGNAAALVLGRAVVVYLIARRGGYQYETVLLSDSGGTLEGNYSRILPLAAFDPYEQCPDMYDRLARMLGDVDRVILDCPREHREAWIDVLKGANIQAEMLAPEIALMRPLGIAQFGGKPTVVVARGPLNVPDRVLKRLFDLAVAGTALLVLAPILILTAIAIKLESKGPILFVQSRIGRANRQFSVYKFRSMRADAGDKKGDRSTGRDDDRVTRVGRIIRRYSIDELPQFINVLIGEMSVVGPRPHAVGSRAEAKLFWEIDQRYWHRHAAKPGLTGLAQVRGFRGATEREDDLVNRLQADLEYLDGWSLWRDVKIIAATFRVLFHTNAY